MLPLWRDQVLVAVAPNYLSMVRLRGYFGRYRIIAKEFKSFNLLSGKAKPWQQVIDTLGSNLKESVWHQTNIKVVLANSLAHYSILPWTEDILSQAEEQKYAAFKVKELYGHDDSHWHISLSEASFGAARMLCAIPAELNAQLNQISSKQPVSIESIQPHLVSSLNYWHKELKDKNFQFVMCDGEKILVTTVKNHHVVNVRAEQVNSTVTDEMFKSCLQRESLMSAESPDLVNKYLFITGQAQVTDAGLQALKLKRLESQASHNTNPAKFLATHLI